jgi:hypothetical protein
MLDQVNLSRLSHGVRAAAMLLGESDITLEHAASLVSQ